MRARSLWYKSAIVYEIDVRTFCDSNGDGWGDFPEEELYLRPITEGSFGLEAVNVADQTARSDSLLNWMRRLISTRKEIRAVSDGSWELLKTGDPAVLGIRYQTDVEVSLIYHNLSSDERRVDGPDEGDGTHLYEVFADADYEPPDPGTGALEINGYGYRWLNGHRRLAQRPGHVSKTG